MCLAWNYLRVKITWISFIRRLIIGEFSNNNQFEYGSVIIWVISVKLINIHKNKTIRDEWRKKNYLVLLIIGNFWGYFWWKSCLTLSHWLYNPTPFHQLITESNAKCARCFVCLHFFLFGSHGGVWYVCVCKPFDSEYDCCFVEVFRLLFGHPLSNLCVYVSVQAAATITRATAIFTSCDTNIVENAWNENPIVWIVWPCCAPLYTSINLCNGVYVLSVLCQSICVKNPLYRIRMCVLTNDRHVEYQMVLVCQTIYNTYYYRFLYQNIYIKKKNRIETK